MGSLERFEAKFVPEPNSGCWLWTAAYDDKGYGRFNFGGRASVQAQRVAWVLYRGAIPTGHAVCHKCDTPACVNPSHLFTGTQADNMRDCRAKGRAVTPMGRHELAKTHCRNGHPYAGDNLFWAHSKRRCRICVNANQRAYTARLRAS